LNECTENKLEGFKFKFHVFLVCILTNDVVLKQLYGMEIHPRKFMES
jgi:hypothetical protein